MSRRRKTAAKPPEETPRTARDWLHDNSAKLTIENTAKGLSATLAFRSGPIDVTLAQPLDHDRIDATVCELVTVARATSDAVPFPF